MCRSGAWGCKLVYIVASLLKSTAFRVDDIEEGLKTFVGIEIPYRSPSEEACV